MRTKADKKPTWTFLILDLLVKSDDFLNLEQIMAGTGANKDQATATLTHLHRRHAIDVVDSGNRLWWFATRETDTRSKTVDERTPEPKGNRTRGRRFTKVTLPGERK